MYSITLLNQSISSCIMLPISFSPCLVIQCQAILHSSIFIFIFFFTISCISIRVNRDVTSPPVNHCWGWLLEMDWADIQAAPLLSLHLNRPVWCGQRGREVMSRGNGERQSVLILTHNPTHGPSVTSSSASCIWCLLGRGANWVGVSCLNWFKCIKEIRSAVCSVV